MLDFLGNLFGGAIGAGGSVAGAQITANEQMAANQANIAAQQQINQQNIQQAQWMATGQYLPGLVSSAGKAGINPLAALGLHTPGFGASIAPDIKAPDTGRGVAGAASAFANAFLTPHDLKMRKLDETSKQSQIDMLNAQNSELERRTAVTNEVLNRLGQNPSWIPQGWSEPASQTGLGIPQVQWLKDAFWRTQPNTLLRGGPWQTGPNSWIGSQPVQ